MWRRTFRIVFLGDGKSPFFLELTWLKDREKPYDLGEKEYHLAFTTDQYENAAQPARANGRDLLRKALLWGSISIADPDGYWIEIVPEKRVRDGTFSNAREGGIAPYYAGEKGICTCVVKTTGYAGGFNLIREKERLTSFKRTGIGFISVAFPQPGIGGWTFLAI